MAAQLAGYISAASYEGVSFSASDELGDWADHFHVLEGFWDLGEVGPAVRAHLRPPLGTPFGESGMAQAAELLAGDWA